MDEIKGEVSTQLACQWLGIPRSTYYRWRKRLDVQVLNPLVSHIRRLCQEHRFRYGYRKITALLRRVMQVNHKRVQRIMREEGLQCRVKVKKAKENRTTDTGCGSSFKTGFSGESSATEAGHRHYLPALRWKNVVLIQYHGLIQWRDHRLQYWR
ncbi:putative transposase OrfB [Brevibacillus laterosporus LMG 15441]|uniref:Putative transposase OrfB n=1 Tax=Brevibacillus laterosporus LMG 15441 TaxID=1042163 RepID=A0A075R0B3_BRELA|nr:putative transposase OrfB [Brevibacillus laterosporus LMG 15441]